MSNEILYTGTQYVVWNHTVDSPECWGTRDYVIEYLVGIDKMKEEYARQEIALRMERTDSKGTSALYYHLEPAEKVFIFEQKGYVRFTELDAFLDSHTAADVFDESLLHPFEDE